MSRQKLSLICTVLNEEKSIANLIDSIAFQSRLPEEVIIVDGGSSDGTVTNIKYQISNIKKNKKWKKVKFKVFTKKGNRSVGRNEGIKHASSEIILLTDSGCVLDKDWVKNIVEPFNKKSTDVVAGYYKGIATNIFQKSLIPYVLVMPDRVNEKEFLPATRSMAFKKSIWKKIGGFNEKLSHNEDYAFANKLKKQNAKIAFEEKAIVNWVPRKNLKEAFIMFFRFALGDAESAILRDKVIFIFLRYIFAFYLILLSAVMRSVFLNAFIIFSFLSYLIWSVKKNYKYVKDKKAFIYLPLLQFISDAAVMLGTTLGLMQKISIKSFIFLILNNKGVAIIIFLYVLSMLSVITYGIPNTEHPFNYFMDEWHQSQSVRALFTQGTPNVSGAANGSIFQFFLTGLYLIPFQLLGFIDVFAIKSSVTNLDLQFRLFEVLRLNTIIFGVLSIITFTYIAKKYFKLNTFISAFLFTFNPLWIMLSGYFKYDIALMFWILVSFWFFLRYAQNPNFLNFFLGGVFTGLALSTKLLTPLPLVAVYISVFLIFSNNLTKSLKYLIGGLTACLFVYVFFGNPDIILGKGSLYEYLYSNLFVAPKTSDNMIFGMSLWQYLLTKLYPATFGKVLYFSFLISFVAGLFYILKDLVKKENKKQTFDTLIHLRSNSSLTIFVLGFIFFTASLLPAGIQAISNRLVVILPFVALFPAILANKLYFNIQSGFVKKLFLFFTLFLMLFQLAESYSWFKIKWGNNPRQVSSYWIQNNIPKETLIGIENIPIYQQLPDIVLKEFYLVQYNKKNDNYFKYKVINPKSEKLPDVVIITNDEIENKYVRGSEKNNLTRRLKKENYKKIVVFKPNFSYFKLFNQEKEYYFSALIQAPNTISIYEK